MTDRKPAPPLPIESVLPALLDALRHHGRAVLQAPPGAGKTTRVPLAILDAGITGGRILMLEPRRLAARAAAERMAETLGEPVGRTIGYRMRGAVKVSKSTRIEVVTEGLLTRMIQSDPELTGIGAVIFDEFHERSLNADLGLALTWEIREALRPDLILLAMSATLDAGPVATLLDDAPLVTSEGTSFPVETRWLDRPVPHGQRFESALAGLIRTALSETKGGLLAFLPGEGEIRRLSGLLQNDLPSDVTLHPLYGALPFTAQRAAIAPAAGGRKLVLATAIAETALTIRDVRVVVDGGKARRSTFDPGRGMARLVTERVSRAEAVQRRGRAGRVAPGWCYRLWTSGEDGSLSAFPPPEIAAADLTGLALDLALWGVKDPGDLRFLTPPPDTGLANARALLCDLGALNRDHSITDHGRTLAALPLHPRLGHMLTRAGPDAAPLAALLGERDPLRGAGADISLRLRALRAPARHGPARAALERIAVEGKRLRRLAGPGDAGLSHGEQAALAYPDRIALRRDGDAARFILSGGTGAAMDDHDPLAGQRLLVVTDVDGAGRDARIRGAATLSESELRAVYGDRIDWVDVCQWSRRERRVLTRRQERFGALILTDRIWPDAPPDTIARAMLDGLRDLGLPWSAAATRLRARIELVRVQGGNLPDCGDEALLSDAENWLLPYLTGITDATGLSRLNLVDPLKARLGWDGVTLLDTLAPPHFETPLGRKVPLGYSQGVPEIAVRLQEMFGVTRHPTVGPERVPVKVTLLSPGQKPLQVTTDLPGFWDGAYDEVRKEMRGRYPKHPWPEDPRAEAPTLRAKPRR